MPSEGHIVGQLLLKLAEEGGKGGTNKESRFRTRLLGHLQNSDWAPSHYPVERENLPYRLGRSSVNFFKEKGPRAYIQLKPVVEGDHILPYLSVAANETLSEFRLLLLVFMEETQDGPLKSVGLRFESPEDQGEKGKHNYWHVQLTPSFVRNEGQSHPSTPSWLPSSTPAIPLDASSAASCVVALAVALYGRVAAATLVHNLKPGISDKAVRCLLREVRALSANRSDQKCSDGPASQQIGGG